MKSIFNKVLLISFFLFNQSNHVHGQTWKEKAKAKYDALQAKVNGDAPTDQKTKSKEKEEEVEEEKKVKIIDLGTHPEQSQLTTYHDSKFYTSKKYDLDQYRYNISGEFIKKSYQSTMSCFQDEIIAYYSDGNRKYVPYERSTEDKGVFYESFKYGTGKYILVGDNHLYFLFLEEGKWDCNKIVGDEPLTNNKEVLIASIEDHFTRAKEASKKAYQNYEDSKFNLSSLKYDDINKVDLQFNRKGDDPKKGHFPGIYIYMKDGQVHHTTFDGGLMNVAKQVKVTPMVTSEDGNSYTYSFKALHDPRITCTKTFGENLLSNLKIYHDGSFGGNGASLTISIKTKKSDAGKDYLSVKVEGYGEPEYHKLATFGGVSISANGGNGVEGSKGAESRSINSYSGDGGDGGDGGNGGNVTIIVDPNVKNGEDFKLSSVSVNGGSAGSFGKSGACWDCKGTGKPGANGNPGKKGTFTFKIEKVDI